MTPTEKGGKGVTGFLADFAERFPSSVTTPVTTPDTRVGPVCNRCRCPIDRPGYCTPCRMSNEAIATDPATLAFGRRFNAHANGFSNGSSKGLPYATGRVIPSAQDMADAERKATVTREDWLALDDETSDRLNR